MNWSLQQVGINGPRWLGDPTWAMIAVIIVSVWQVMGYNMVILLAGLQGVPQELLEAASIDGAGKMRRFWHITVPLITPTIFFLSIISVINSFQVFGLIYVMTGGGPGARPTSTCTTCGRKRSSFARWGTRRRCRGCCSWSFWRSPSCSGAWRGVGCITSSSASRLAPPSGGASRGSGAPHRRRCRNIPPSR